MTSVSLAAAAPQGPVADAIAELFWLMVGLGSVVFLAVVALLVRGLVRGSDADHAGDVDHAGDADRRGDQRRLVRRWVIGGGVVLPLLVIVVVFGATLRTMRAIPTAAPGGALTVEVTAHQFWWEIHYPEQDVTTANELYVPVGRPIAVELISDDVIHSFWVPALGGKMDALPDGVNTLVIEADEPGEHETECAEFCGLQHANMGLLVVAEPPDAFDDWIATQRQPAAEPVDAEALRGQEIFLGSDCATCHAVRGTSANATTGPDLTHLADRRTLGADVVPNTPEDLTAWVADAQALKPGAEMPAADLSDDELDALVTYLGGLE